MKRLLALSLCLLMLAPLALSQEVPQIDVLDEAQLTPTPRGMHHYLLLCVDQWRSSLNNLGNSDGMVLVTVDEGARRIMTTSLIRDMLVMRPDGKLGKITHVLSNYGIQGLLDTINIHFGIKIEKYILMDWNQVQSIVDAVGGVKIRVSGEEANYLRRYAISPSSTKPAMAGAGTYHFSGHAAVIYMRIRRVNAMNGDGHDVGRTYRTRLVLSSIADSLKDVSYLKATAILDSVVKHMLATNLSTAELLEAFEMAYDMRGLPVEPFRLPIDGSFKPLDYYGNATQEVEYAINRKAFSEFLNKTSYVVTD